MKIQNMPFPKGSSKGVPGTFGAGKLNMLLGKLSIASGRQNMLPGKLKIASGRQNMLPGK